jgi:hypothetical protein
VYHTDARKYIVGMHKIGEFFLVIFVVFVSWQKAGEVL